MKHIIAEAGIIDMKGRLRLPMDRLNEFFEANKGRRVVVQFEAAMQGSSDAQLAYYRKYVVPTIQKALWDMGNRMGEQNTERWLREQCPFMDIESVNNLSTYEMSEYLEWLKQYAAENLYVYIEDPKTI